jgi:hypothetical protein
MGGDVASGQAVPNTTNIAAIAILKVEVELTMMQSEHVDNGFAAFYREQAPAVFNLALRHGGDQDIAAECVDTVFTQLEGHWLHVSDPIRFSRRAAVLYVRGSHRRNGRRAVRCQPLAAR